MLFTVKFCALVEKNCFVGKNRKAVSKTGWNPYLNFIFRIKELSKIFSECRRTKSDINNNIKYFSFQNLAKFSLSFRRYLVMKPSYCSFLRSGNIVLNKIFFQTGFFITLLIKRFEKETAVVFINIRFNKKNTIKCSFINFQLILC